MQIIDIVETYRELDADLTDLYLSSLSNRLNEVMKVLTVIATIFMPLSFIASVYGMNFNTQASPYNMPELNWRYGYPFVWALMIASGVGMYLFFRWMKWLGPNSLERQQRKARRELSETVDPSDTLTKAGGTAQPSAGAKAPRGDVKSPAITGAHRVRGR